MKEEIFFISENIDSGQKSSLGWVENSASSLWLDSKNLNSGFLSLSVSSKKITIFFLIIIIALLCLLFRSAYLQIFKSDYYYGLAENNRIRTEYEKAHRGIIYDRSGKALVQNVFGFSLSVVPALLPKDESEKNAIVKKISTLSLVSEEDIFNTIESADNFYHKPVLIKSGIGYDNAMMLKINSSQLPGVVLDMDSWRKYPNGESFSNIMGYVGKINTEEYANLRDKYLLNDNIGKSGLEKQYEQYLKGQHGQKKFEVDSLGREKKIVYEVPFEAGADLVLSIDLELQKKIYEILNQKLKGSYISSVVVSNPSSGEILAMVDYPSFDNNLFAQGISAKDYKSLVENPQKPLYARSFLGEYPSGSTVKIIGAVGALQEGIIGRNTSINSAGGIYVGKWFFPDWKAGGHGATNVVKAISESVNTFFYYIGGGYGDFNGMGVGNLSKYYRLFGLGEKTGIDMPSESSGFVPSEEWKKTVVKEQWYIGDTYHLSIGQGHLLVTPLQVNSYTSAIANGGTLYKPKLLYQINNANGNIDIIPKSVSNKDFVQKDNIEIVKEGMRQAVISGSARNLSDLKVEVAGKTGTAQWNTNKQNHAWFTGFAPYSDPNFCITVLVEEGGEGSAVAVPIAKEIINYWFTRE